MLIKDFGTVHLDMGEQFPFANNLCVWISAYITGVMNYHEPAFDGNILISGASWMRSHLMFYATSEIRQFVNINETKIAKPFGVTSSKISKENRAA